jgi:MYXO-CTERM domain-containing protein
VTDQFTATGSSVTLSFTGSAQQAGFFGPAIDNVGIALVAAAVPEPSSWAIWTMAAAGAAMVIGWRRRRAH